MLNGHPSSTFTATLPPNMTYFVLNGTSSPTLAYYTVTLTPPPLGGPGSSTFNALQGYTNDVVFYMAPLDPAVQYSVQFGVGGNVLTGNVGVHSMVFWSALW